MLSNLSAGNSILLNVQKLKKYFEIRKGVLKRVVGYIKAVDGIDFFIRKGETLGFVGESGCGKSTVGKSIIRLIEPTEGDITFFRRDSEGRDNKIDISALNKKDLKQIRKDIQIIFQDPFSSLDPRMTVGNIIGEALIIHKVAAGKQKEERVIELLENVGLQAQHMKRYPHEFSGGQRQRIGVARAVALDPQLVICDEPVTALDVSVQAQVLNLLRNLQKKFGLTYLFIAHDLSVIEHISDRIAVMYLGKLVEITEKEKLFNFPKHPYTEALMSAVPIADPDIKREKIVLKGDVPSPADPPSGCYFHPRCQYAKPICNSVEPKFRDCAENHYTTCHFADSLELKGVEGVQYKEKS